MTGVCLLFCCEKGDKEDASLHLHQSLPLHLVLHLNLYDIVHTVGGPHLTWMYDSANTSVISCRPRARACALSTGIYNKRSAAPA